MHNSFRRVSLSRTNEALFSDCVQFIRDLVAELPFILMHPKPDDIDDNIAINENNSPNNAVRNSGGEKQHSGNNSSASAKDDAPNLIQLDGSVKKEFF